MPSQLNKLASRNRQVAGSSPFAGMSRLASWPDRTAGSLCCLLATKWQDMDIGAVLFGRPAHKPRRWTRFPAMPLRSRHPGVARQNHGRVSRPSATHAGLYLDECRAGPADSLFGS